MENKLSDINQYKKEKPLAYKIYVYLKKNCVGYSKRAKSRVLMKEFDIHDNKTLRYYIEEIRDSEILQKIVCSKAGKIGSGYWIASNYDEVEDTLKHLYLRSMKMLKTYSILKNKARLNNQRKIIFGKYEKDIYQSIMEENNEKSN